MGNCCCCCCDDDDQSSDFAPLRRPVFVRSTSIAQRRLRLTMRKHLVGNTFDVTTEDGQKLFEIHNDWTSFLHHTKEVRDGRTNLAIAEIKKRANPAYALRSEYKCETANRNDQNRLIRHLHKLRRDKGHKPRATQPSAEIPKKLFKTHLDWKLIGQDPTILKFDNQGSDGKGEKLVYKDKRLSRYNPVTYKGRKVATIKKNFSSVSREYELDIVQGMDYFLIVGLAIIHDDIEIKKQREDD